MAPSEVKQSIKRENDLEESNGEDIPPPKKHTISNDDLYRRSTQFEVWSFTQESFEEHKQKANVHGRKAATSKFNKAFKELQAKSPEVFENFKDELNAEKLLDLLTYEEEQKYLNYYTKIIIPTCNHFKMPTQVKATAVSFFKKFYLLNSVSEHHPKNILYTCVFLAAKSENYFISIESFVKPLAKVLAQDILDLEFNVLQSLKFTLLVHHPFRPLYGFFLDFQAVLLHPSPLMYDVSVDTIGSLYDNAKKWLNDYALLSDVAFLFTPPQIALAAMYDIDKRITDRYLKRKFMKEVKQEVSETKLEVIKEETEEKDAEIDDKKPTESPSQREQYETIVKTIRKCIRIAKQITETSKEESTEIDRKCFYTLNPHRLIKKRVHKLTSPSPTTEAKE